MLIICWSSLGFVLKMQTDALENFTTAYQSKPVTYLSANQGLIYDVLFLRELLVWPQQTKIIDTNDTAKAERHIN